MLLYDYEFGDDDTFRVYDPDYPNISFTVRIDYYGSGWREFNVTMFYGKKYQVFIIGLDFKKLDKLCVDKIKEHGD